MLELMAGTGRLAIPLAMAGHQVTAVDLDAAMLARAKAAWARSKDGADARRQPLVGAGRPPGHRPWRPVRTGLHRPQQPRPAGHARATGSRAACGRPTPPAGRPARRRHLVARPGGSRALRWPAQSRVAANGPRDRPPGGEGGRCPARPSDRPRRDVHLVRYLAARRWSGQPSLAHRPRATGDWPASWPRWPRRPA